LTRNQRTVLWQSDCLAEREGFEPPIPVKVCPLSRRIVSTTHAPLRAVEIVMDILTGKHSHPSHNVMNISSLMNTVVGYLE
jgi:hypothetical protein